MNLQIIKVEYNWHDGLYDEYAIGESYYTSQTETSILISILQYSDEFHAIFENGADITFTNYNKIYREEIKPNQ